MSDIKHQYYLKNRARIIVSVKKYNLLNSAKIKKYQRKYYLKNKVHRNILTKKYYLKHRKHLLLFAKKWRDNNRLKSRNSVIKWKMKNLEKVKAHTAVAHAIRDKILPKFSFFVCEICKHKKAEIYHHFMGYSVERRLDVMPLCRRCHTLIHYKENVKI